MFCTIQFYHPNWQNAFAFTIPDYIGIYDAAIYLNQAGYIPFHANGYALAFRGQWLMDNYSVGSLGLQAGEAVLIVPLEAKANGKASHAATPKFKGRGDGIIRNPEAEEYFKKQAPPVGKVNANELSKKTFLEWIKNLLR